MGCSWAGPLSLRSSNCSVSFLRQSLTFFFFFFSFFFFFTRKTKPYFSGRIWFSATLRRHRTGCHSYWWWCLVDDLVLAAITFHRVSFYHVCGVEYHHHKKCGSATVGVAECGHKPNILPAFKKKVIHQTNDLFIRVIHEAMFSSRNCSFCLGVKLVINWTRCTARVVFLKYMTNMRLFQGIFFYHGALALAPGKVNMRRPCFSYTAMIINILFVMWQYDSQDHNMWHQACFPIILSQFMTSYKLSQRTYHTWSMWHTKKKFDK
jgi:hypothetical protein